MVFSQVIPLKTPENQYALRFLDPSKSLPHEYYMLELVSKQGVAPHVYHMDAEKGIILMAYVNDAKTISLDEAKLAILPITSALHQVHSIPKAPFPLMRLIDKIRHNCSKLKCHSLINESCAKTMSEIEELHLKLEAQGYPQSMIHGDLHGKNMFLTKEGSVLIIDWEGACYDDPFFDLAYSVCTLNFNPELEGEYLSTYLGYTANDEEWRHYLLCKKFVLLGIYFELLEYAYHSNGFKPFVEIQEVPHSWEWYVERFMDSSQPGSPEHLYHWANAALHLAKESIPQ
ncbi:MAG TPA: hypothetical protein DCE71_06290 [Parachlamydiales bacterium]|nr:hypothetical protein [Parachlamydiales bacterium]